MDQKASIEPRPVWGKITRVQARGWWSGPELKQWCVVFEDTNNGALDRKPEKWGGLSSAVTSGSSISGHVMSEMPFSHPSRQISK